MQLDKHIVDEYNRKFGNVAKPNEPVLIVTKKIKYFRPFQVTWRPAVDRRPSKVTHLFFGIISKEEPYSVMKSGTLEIIMPHHVQNYGHGIHIQDGNITVMWGDTQNVEVDKELIEPSHRMADLLFHHPDFSFEVIVGHDAIQKYCELRGYEYIQFYLKSTRLLKLQDVRLLPELFTINENARELIINNIIAAVNQRKEAICSHNASQKAYVEKRLKELLSEALEYWMDKTPYIKMIEHCPGFKIDVCQTVQELSERLGVKESISA